jgi:hypothetical protein
MFSLSHIAHPLKSIRRWSSLRKQFDGCDMSILNRNVEMRSWRTSERCFILGTSPSMRKVDLAMLRSENCLCINLFGLHKDVGLLEKSMHIYSGLASHKHISEESGVSFYKTLHDRIPKNGLYVTNILDQKFIESHALLVGRKLFYVALIPGMHRLLVQQLDLTRPIYGSYSVSQIAIQLALSMGYKTIVLLGIDHDGWFLHQNRQNPHFYDPQDCPLERNLPPYWERAVDWHHQFRVNDALWSGYKVLNEYAKRNSTEIINASEDGILNIFPRVNMSHLLNIK